MAKTTSQIVKKNKERQEKVKEVVKHSKSVDAANEDLFERSSKKTSSILGNAAAGTSDSSKKKDLYSAIKVVSDTKKSEPKTQSTATSMQKKKEDRMEAKNPVDSLYLRKTFAEKQLKDFDEKNENPEYWQDVKEKRAYDVKRKELQDAVDRAGADLQARDDARTHATNMQDIANMAPEEQQLLQDAVKSRQNKSIADNGTTIGGLKKIYELKQMYDLLPLVRKYGDARTLELLEALEREENQKKAMDYQAKGQEAAASGPVASVAANIASIPINAVAGMESAYSRAKEMLFRTGQYNTLSPYTSGDQYAALAGGVRQQTMQNIEGEDPNLLQKGVSIGYQGVMAAADSIARAFLGGGAIGGSTLAATNSFAQTMSEASQQGATPAQASIMATTTAGIEYLSEKIPLDNLIKTAKGTGLNSAILNALRQAGIEATTEEISLMATVLAEAAILQEHSAYQQRITGLILQGVAPEEARRQANMDIVNEAVNTLLVSAVSGSVSSAAGSYADYRGMFAAEQEQTTEAAPQPQTHPQTEVQQEMVQEQTPAVQPQQEAQTTPQVQQQASAPTVDTQKESSQGGHVQQQQEQSTKVDNNRQQQTEMSTETAPQTTEMSGNVDGMSTNVDENAQQIKGTGAAEQNFTGAAEYENMLYDGNIQKNRATAARDVEMPKTDNDGRRVTEFAGNAATASVTPEPMTDAIKSLVADKKLSFDTRTNQQSLENAAQAITSDGEDNVRTQISYNAQNGIVKDGDIEKGLVLYAQYANDPSKQDAASGLLVDMAAIANMSGRNLQLFSLMQRMTPEGQIMTVKKNIQRTIDSMNKTRSGKKQIDLNGNKERQTVGKKTTEAVKEARKKTGDQVKRAATKIKYRSGKVEIEGNQAGEPFVFEYAQKVGEALANSLRKQPKQKHPKTFMQNITSELRRFANEKMPKAQKERNLTPSELLKDYIANQEFYLKAWETAQYELQQTNPNDPRLQTFMHSGIGVDANTDPQNKIFARALAQAAMESGETDTMLRQQEALGITNAADNIANKLIQDTGATGEMAQTIRDAAKEYVNQRLQEAENKPNAKEYTPDYFINQAMRDIRTTMSQVAKQKKSNREIVKKSVIDLLTKKYGFGQADASHIADVVGDRFDLKAQDQAQKILEQKFGEREKSKGKSAGEKIEEYANLGAFDENSQYSDKATESFIRAAMADIGTTITKVAKSGKADKASVKAQISQMITERHGIEKADADRIADVVGEQFSKLVQNQSRKILEQKFTPKEKAQKKTAAQLFEEYANLGAFDIGSDFNESAALKVTGIEGMQINEELTQNFLNAKNETEKEAALDAIYKDVAARIKPTLGEMWDAWRNLSMLGNVETHERNFLSTGAWAPYAEVQRTVAAAIEKVFIKQENRTKSILGPGKRSADLLKWAKEDVKSKAVQDLMSFSGTTGNEARNAIQDYRKILPGPLDTIRKKNMTLMETEDMFWKKREYSISLASFLKARGYTAADIQNNRVPKGVLDEGRQLAVNDAMKATFNDRNKFSNAMSKLRVKGSGGWSTAINTLSKGAMPFLRTPANIVVRVTESNPLSLLYNAATLKKNVDSGKYTMSEGISRIASGFTGTGMMVLGAAMAAGVIPNVKLVGRIEDEEQVEKGAMEYSVKVGDTYYSLGFLAPAAIPLFIGANLYNNWNNSDGISDAWDVVDAFMNIGADSLDPLLELSMLSSLNDMIENVEYEETAGGKMLALVTTAAMNYFTQALPTILGQAEQATEDTKTATYVNTDNPTEARVKRILSNASNRIPGVDLYRTEKLDEFGEPIKPEGTQLERFVEAFLNPFTKSKVKSDPVRDEILRINKTPGNNVTPPYMPKTITYTDSDGNTHENYRLSEEEYQAVAQTQGQTAKRILDTMISSDNYKAMSDEEKAKAINQVYSYARVKAQVDNIDNHTGYDEAWMMDLKEGREAEEILRITTNNVINSAMTSLQSAWDNGYQTESRSKDLEAAYDSYKEMEAAQKRQVREFATGNSARYLEARDKGIPHQTAVTVFKKVADLKPEKDYTKVRDIQIREAIAQIPGLTDKSKDTLLRAYMPDYDPKDKNPQTTELKYNEIRELGISPEGYTDAYRDYLDASGTGKRRRTIKHYQDEYGWNRKTATSVYDLLAGYSKPWKE